MEPDLCHFTNNQIYYTTMFKQKPEKYISTNIGEIPYRFWADDAKFGPIVFYKDDKGICYIFSGIGGELIDSFVINWKEELDYQNKSSWSESILTRAQAGLLYRKFRMMFDKCTIDKYREMFQKVQRNNPEAFLYKAAYSLKTYGLNRF